MLANYFGSVRFVYNHFLAKRKEQYEQTRKSSNYYEQAKELTAMKKTEAFSYQQSDFAACLAPFGDRLCELLQGENQVPTLSLKETWGQLCCSPAF